MLVRPHHLAKLTVHTRAHSTHDLIVWNASAPCRLVPDSPELASLGARDREGLCAHDRFLLPIATTVVHLPWSITRSTVTVCTSSSTEKNTLNSPTRNSQVPSRNSSRGPSSGFRFLVGGSVA